MTVSLFLLIVCGFSENSLLCVDCNWTFQEKLRLSLEQELVRVFGNLARTKLGKDLPYGACSIIQAQMIPNHIKVWVYPFTFLWCCLYWEKLTRATLPRVNRDEPVFLTIPYYSSSIVYAGNWLGWQVRVTPWGGNGCSNGFKRVICPSWAKLRHTKHAQADFSSPFNVEWEEQRFMDRFPFSPYRRAVKLTWGIRCHVFQNQLFSK